MMRSTSLLLPLFSGLAAATLICRPEGPVLPKPALQDTPAIKDAAASLTKTLDAAVSGAIKAGWPVENVSFSLAVISKDQKDPGVPLWEYHHLATNNVIGTKKLDRDSQYLIGSVSKVISDYILLKSGVDINTPVTKYLSELKDSPSRIRWEDVTLKMLASQLSGAPTNYGFSEFYYLKEVFLATASIPNSRTISYQVLTIALDFLKGMTKSYPVVAPMERPAYSNIAYTILVMAIEEATGKNYTQLVENIVAKPLDLQNTVPSPGDDKRAVIPPGDSGWGADYGYNAPGGGLVSSLGDLSKFAHAIMTRSIDLTPTQVRQWLKPQAYSGGFSAVGMPWEIFRPHNLTPKHPHPVTIFVVDEYGLSLVVLTAGPMNAVTFLTDAILGTFVPAADEASRAQAKKEYARTFKSGCAKNNTSMIDVSFDLDNHSLVISSIRRNGSDILAAMTKIWSMTMGQFTSNFGSTVRLFPADLDEKTTLHGKPVTSEVWRLWPEFASIGESDLPRSGTLMDDCVMWTLGDWVHYGGEPMDRVLFYRDGDGHVVGFEAPFLRSGILQLAKNISD
ncbi:hypothetical protein TOPH_04614 [Tolypocladium ophioglossoides CBS 100239]|uniref:Uncharacterized protein n=1 Tax=Tolypocladium ophioglossoides (strain CBS 100239) TaxID=1163406 RepID=A0A0L0NAJ9_TOLOC|nr:hypothetical protein TOPH_04614 [Tolypocladium ophioglossoides CBS 100239]